MDILTESIYDHPKYYDLVFGADCAAETHFILEVNELFLQGEARRLFEPACGTGRLMFALAKKGYEIRGLDLNPKAVQYTNARFQRAGLPAPAREADMSDFKPGRKWDLAFNTINSFRHLVTEQSALGHLRCMAEGTRKGGLYLIGIHLTPTQAVPSDGESWAARRGHLAVTTRMWALDREPKKRMERFAIEFDIYTPSRQMRIKDELHLRSYTCDQFADLVDASQHWEIAETYDFGYDRPIAVDETSEDVVYVLRRK